MDAYTNKTALPFIYQVSVALAAGIGSTAQQTLIMQADSYFELRAILCMSSLEATTDVIPNYFSVSLRDQTTGNDITNGRIPQRILAGNAFNNGTVQGRPVLFEPQSNLFFDFSNLNAGANTVTIALHGYKIKIS